MKLLQEKARDVITAFHYRGTGYSIERMRYMDFCTDAYRDSNGNAMVVCKAAPTQIFCIEDGMWIIVINNLIVNEMTTFELHQRYTVLGDCDDISND